jgi:hypothetical protein
MVLDEEGEQLLPWDYLILDEGHKVGPGLKSESSSAADVPCRDVQMSAVPVCCFEEVQPLPASAARPRPPCAPRCTQPRRPPSHRRSRTRACSLRSGCARCTRACGSSSPAPQFRTTSGRCGRCLTLQTPACLGRCGNSSSNTKSQSWRWVAAWQAGRGRMLAAADKERLRRGGSSCFATVKRPLACAV